MALLRHHASSVRHVGVDPSGEWVDGWQGWPGILLWQEEHDTGWYAMVLWVEQDEHDGLGGAPQTHEQLMPARCVRAASVERPAPDPATGRPRPEQR